MSTDTPQFETFTGFTPYSTVGPYRAEDYWNLPEGEPVELMRGRFVMSPSPTPLHQILSGYLYEIFRTAAQKSGSLVMYSPMDVVFSDDTILQPDLLYISKDRTHIVKDRVEGAPDLIIEILSPSTGLRDKTEKLDLYAKYGVSEYWIVDPATRAFDFLILDQGRYAIAQQPDNRYQSSKLPEVEIDLAAFWAEVERRLPKRD